MNADASATVRRSARSARARQVLLDARPWLAAYGVALALIAFWPTPVDRGAGDLLRAIRRVFPWLTYDVIEFGSNVLLFVPFGVLLALVLHRRRWIIVPLALATTIVIETGQALLLAQRTPSVRDVIANTLGAAIGLGIVLLLERRRRSPR